jgi:ribose 5-phosphate isomerase RpiB
MNVLCLGGHILGIEVARKLIKSFLQARFGGENGYKRRLDTDKKI